MSELASAASATADYDVFADFSHGRGGERALREYLRALARDAGLAGVAARVTLCAPAGLPPALDACGLALDPAPPGQAPLALLGRAVRLAARARRHLLLLLGGAIAGSELIAELLAGFAQDPLFGSAQPRFAEPAGDRIWPLPGRAEAAHTRASTARSVLLCLPPDAITPELPAAVLVLRWELLIAVEGSEEPGGTLVGGLLELLARARRSGFRNLVRNRVVLATPLPYARLYPAAPRAELERLRARDACAAGAQLELDALPQRRAESLLSAALPERPGARVRLLLDCRGMSPVHNGTANAMHGLLHGFGELHGGWEIDVLASEGAANFHSLARRHPRLRVCSELPERSYAAAVRLNQPWSVAEIAALHRRALWTGFLMLDPIAWDIAPGQSEIEAAWHFAARHADGLLYISHFGAQRFRRRFPVAAQVAEAVTHLSLAREDHTRAVPAPGDPAGPILVFGNAYEHKHVGPTAELLRAAFPFRPIVALGSGEPCGPGVRALASGALPRRALERLLAGAALIVFPSFYEGFGLPVIDGLARGRTVLVRRSPLWAELAAHSRLPGRLCEFDDPASLVDGVGRALGGLPLEPLPSGGALGASEPPADWTRCAQRVLELLAPRLARPDLERWWAREHALLGARA